MKLDFKEYIGKAVHDALIEWRASAAKQFNRSPEKVFIALTDSVTEMERIAGEAAVSAFVARLIPTALPEGYKLIKDKVLDHWHPLRHELFINEYDDKPFRFNSEIEARTFCWIDAMTSKNDAG